MASFTSNVPQSNQFPSTSQPLMLANNQYLASEGNVDHYFTQDSTTDGDGTHKKVTLTDIAAPSIPSGTSSVIYSNTANGQSNLFFKNGAIDGQLTAFNASVPYKASVGASCLPGGILIQWGTGTYSDTNTVTFSTPFSAVYSVVATYSIDTVIGVLGVYNISTTTFNMSMKRSYGSGSITNTPVNWIAIGAA